MLRLRLLPVSCAPALVAISAGEGPVSQAPLRCRHARQLSSDVDVLACPECGGRLRIIAFIAEPTVATKILDHLGLASTGPPTAPARRPPEPLDPAPDYAQADATYDS